MTRPRSDRGEAGPGLIVVGALVSALLFVVVMAAIQWFTADTRGALDAREKTRANGDYRIAAYDRFFDLCAAVQGKELEITNLQTELAGPPTPSPERIAQLQSAVTAQRNTRAQLITQYNADAAKADTRGHFLASGLPYTLDPATEATTCAL